MIVHGEDDTDTQSTQSVDHRIMTFHLTTASSQSPFPHWKPDLVLSSIPYRSRKSIIWQGVQLPRQPPLWLLLHTGVTLGPTENTMVASEKEAYRRRSRARSLTPDPARTSSARHAPDVPCHALGSRRLCHAGFGPLSRHRPHEREPGGAVGLSGPTYFRGQPERRGRSP